MFTFTFADLYIVAVMIHGTHVLESRKVFELCLDKLYQVTVTLSSVFTTRTKIKKTSPIEIDFV